MQGGWSQLAPLLGYVGYFVGAGLISGGIVHYTLDPTRYHPEVAPTAGGDAMSTEDLLKDLADIEARLTTLPGAAG